MRLLKAPPAGLLPALLFILSSANAAEPAQAGPRITEPIDASHRITLVGNTHPLARPEFDRGAAPDQQPLERMLLVLQRSPEQDAALLRLLDEQQTKSSPNYHRWLTPQEFGAQFGPADADVQAVTAWLESQGFQVNRVAAGRTVIEFSGSAGQVRDTFRTDIHKYAVTGGEYWANAGDPQIPAALAPVVAGFASLNNFPRKHFTHTLGTFRRFKNGEVEPLYTFATTQGNYYGLGPTDFATIYNVLPLWNAGVDGSGQTIAIVGESNISLQDSASFRTLFGLPTNKLQVILDGPDPGVVPGDETEADVDTQWAGAVARNATIDLVVSEGTETTVGVDLSALYIVDNNLAPVLSESYGACEAELGASGNAFESSMWEQGAAEGITVIVAAGDQGSAQCDTLPGELAAQNGLAVSGVASTPFNVAMGGTDFDDGNSASTYWNSTNNPTTGASARSYIPETAWNNSCAQQGISACSSLTTLASDGFDLQGGGGGPSTCTQNDGCSGGGYSKPSWQTGAGVPNDHARDLPDLAMFAGDGAHNSFYLVCEADQNGTSSTSCDLNSPYSDFLAVGGTSVPTPAFAGVMALVNQKTGERQGNADYVLYKLAAKSGASCTSNSSAVSNSACIFYDVITGNNSVACYGSSPDCSSTMQTGYGALVSSSSSTTPAWTATAGYDMATGLGSIDATNLVNNWKSVSFTPSTTKLTLSPTTITHGQPVQFTIDVTGGSGKPTGVAALQGSPASSTSDIATFALSGGAAAGSTDLLPGGTYTVTARYSGDGTYGSSTSTPPVSVTVGKESSKTTVALVTFNLDGTVASSSATNTAYGSPYILRSNVTNSAGQSCVATAVACPTGKITLTDSGKPLDLGTYSLNSQGYFEDQPIQFGAGSHGVLASYGGDTSFLASSSGTVPMTITRAVTQIDVTPGSGANVQFGSSLSLVAAVDTQSNGAAPTGTVQFLNGSKPVSGAVTYTGYDAPTSPTGYAQLQAAVTITPSATETLTLSYIGDANYHGFSSPFQVNLTPGIMLSATPASLTIASPGSSGTSTINVNFGGGTFSGPITLACSIPFGMAGTKCSFNPSSLSAPGNTSVTITTTGAGMASRLPDIPTGRMLLIISALLGLLVMARRRRWNPAAALLLCLLAAAIAVACGGGTSGGGGGGSKSTETAAGMYTIGVTASGTAGGSSITNTTNLTVTVQ